MAIDVPRVLFAVRPDGGVSSLPEVFFDLLEVTGARPAAGGLDGGERRFRTVTVSTPAIPWSMLTAAFSCISLVIWV